MEFSFFFFVCYGNKSTERHKRRCKNSIKIYNESVKWLEIGEGAKMSVFMAVANNPAWQERQNFTAEECELVFSMRGYRGLILGSESGCPYNKPSAFLIQFLYNSLKTSSKYNATNSFYTLRPDRLCGLVVRVPGNRSSGPGSILGNTRFSEK
jgi:hypothetical protein